MTMRSANARGPVHEVPPAPADDSVLVERCLSELPYSTAAYESLVRRYEPVVFQTCLRHLADSTEAEEATQDAFIRVFHALPKFEGRASFKTWLFRIVFNVCAARAARRRALCARAENYLQLDVEQAGACDQQRSRAEHLVTEALATLAEADSRVLILHHIWGFTVAEIAQELGLRLSAAKMRLSRAAARFRTSYRALDKSDLLE